MSIEQQCQREVVELHAFFQRWFRGELPGTDAGFARFEVVCAPEFEIISPAGKILDRAAILSVVRDRHGADPAAAIRIANFRQGPEVNGVALVHYEEWQRENADEHGRISTALLRENAGCPNGVEWLHVHETWMSDP